MKPVLKPTPCKSCGVVKDAREYRICHKHHADFRYVPDSWSSECRDCRKKRAAREAYKMKRENEQLQLQLKKYTEKKEARALSREEEALRLSRLKFAKSVVLKLTRVDRQQVKRMDKRKRKLQNIARYEHARLVRTNRISELFSAYEQQLIDIEAGLKPAPLNRS